jgi:hypothetical protein
VASSLVSNTPGAAAVGSEARTAGLLPVVLVGVLAGVTSGLFGVGGGIVIVPALVMLAKFPHKLAVGTSLTAIVPISSAAVIGYATGGEVDWAAALCVCVGALAGAIVGTRLLVSLPTRVLQLVFAATMIVTAVRMLFEDEDATGRADLTVGMVAAMVALGLVAGILAGLLGVGGGVIIVPVLTLLFGIPHVLAKGTSLAVIVPTATVGTIRNRKTGLTALRPAAIVGTAGIASAFAASKVSLGLDPRVSQALFAGLLVFAAVRLLRDGRTPEQSDV